MPQRAKSDLEHYVEGTKPQVKPPAPSQFVGGRPKCPKHLSASARTEFKRCVKLLEHRRTITPADADTLAVYVVVLTRWIAAKEQMGDQLMVTTTITDSHGEAHEVERIHPLLKVIEKAEASLIRMESRLGLTPTDREKSKVTKPGSGEDVVPGSMRDLYPEMYGGKVTPIRREEEPSGNA